MSFHALKVAQIQKVLKEQKGGYFNLKKNRVSNTLRNGEYKKRGGGLDLSSLNEVIEFNPEEEWIRVEPRMTFKTLCDFTLPYGLIPLVVPEFASITIGGAIMGAALESSSHAQGQFNDTCLEYECLLGNGECLLATEYKHSDLFYAIAGSYGTLAILTAVTLKLKPAKKWVHLTYHHFTNPTAALNLLKIKTDSEFMEGVIYDPRKALVITGQQTDSETLPIFFQKRASAPWYAHHLLSTTHTEERMPLRDYLFRWNLGAFWMGRYIASAWTMIRLLLHLGIPSLYPHSLELHPLLRLLFGWAFTSENLYKVWHRLSNHITEHLFFIHDFYLPLSHVEQGLAHFMEHTDIYPIWLCPIKGTDAPQLLSPHYGQKKCINIGLYGCPPHTHSIPRLAQQLEKDLLLFGGRKMLYSFTYYDQVTFDKIYFEDTYTQLRTKYLAEGVFPTLFTKVTQLL